jgi:hypothetical protein
METGPAGTGPAYSPHGALSAWSSQFAGLRSRSTRIPGNGLKPRINRAGRDAFRRHGSTAMDLRASDGNGLAPNYCLGVFDPEVYGTRHAHSMEFRVRFPAAS